MPIYVAQENYAGAVGGNYASYACSFTADVVAGSVIHVCVSSGGGNFNYVADSQGNGPSGKYTQIGAAVASSAGNSNTFSHYYAVAGSSGPLTVTLYFTITTSYPGIWIKEIRNASGTLVAHSEHTGSQGGGTDTITSGSASNTEAAALISAWCQDGNITAGATTGTGFTTGLTNTLFYTATESKRITTTGSFAATFTSSAVSGWDTVMAIFAEAGSSGASGSAAITEGADSVSGTGSTSTAGGAAITEGTDTVSASGSTSTAGTAAITEGADTVSASGVAGAGGIASITEGSDSVSASGATSTAGTASITEGADAVAASGVASTAGSGSSAEASDVASGAGAAGASGSAAPAEGADAAAGVGQGSTAGAGAAVESPDVAASAAAGSPAGAGASTEGADIASGTGGGGTAVLFPFPVQALTARRQLRQAIVAALERASLTTFPRGVGAGSGIESPDAVSASGAGGTTAVSGEGAAAEGSDTLRGIGSGGAVFPFPVQSMLVRRQIREGALAALKRANLTI